MLLFEVEEWRTTRVQNQPRRSWPYRALLSRRAAETPRYHLRPFGDPVHQKAAQRVGRAGHAQSDLVHGKSPAKKRVLRQPVTTGLLVRADPPQTGFLASAHHAVQNLEVARLGLFRQGLLVAARQLTPVFRSERGGQKQNGGVPNAAQ